MNYSVFEQMETGAYEKKAGETAQEYMERILRAVCVSEPETDHVIVNDMMNPLLISCNSDDGSVIYQYVIEPWMQNPNGTLHGGIMGTMFDVGMGIQARFYKQTRRCSTVNLNINYTNGVPAGTQTVNLVVKADKIGKRLIFSSGKLYNPETNKIYATASSAFM